MSEKIRLKKQCLLLALVLASSLSFAQSYDGYQADAAEKVKAQIQPILETISYIGLAVQCKFVDGMNGGAAVSQLEQEMIRIAFYSRVGIRDGVDLKKMRDDALNEGLDAGTKKGVCQLTTPVWRAQIVETVHHLIRSIQRPF